MDRGTVRLTACDQCATSGWCVLVADAYICEACIAAQEAQRERCVSAVVDAFKVATWTESKTWLELATVAVDAVLAAQSEELQP